MYSMYNAYRFCNGTMIPKPSVVSIGTKGDAHVSAHPQYINDCLRSTLVVGRWSLVGAGVHALLLKPATIRRVASAKGSGANRWALARASAARAKRSDGCSITLS